MVDNKIIEIPKPLVVEEKTTIEAEQPAQKVFFDPSTPSARSIVRVVLITLLILAVAGFLQGLVLALTHLFFLIILAVFFAYLISPLVEIIRHPFNNPSYERYMPRTAAIVIAYLIVFSVLGVALTFLTPVVVGQAKQFSVNLPEYADAIQTKIAELGTRFERYQVPANVQTEINDKVALIVGIIGAGITSFLLNAVFYIPWLILIPILAFFFLKDIKLFRISLLRFFPSGDWRTRVESIIHDVNTTLVAYVRAQLVSCVFIGTICTVAFSVIGVRYALLLGILAGIFEFIPLIGPLTIAATVITVASLESVSDGIYVLLFLGILRILQDYVFYPRIIREGIHLHPLAIILSVLAGEEIAGIPGVFLSVPIIALLTVLYKHVLEYSGNRKFATNILVPTEPVEKTAAQQ